MVDKDKISFIFNTLFSTIRRRFWGLAFDYGFYKNFFWKILTISTPYYTHIFNIYFFKSLKSR